MSVKEKLGHELSKLGTLHNGTHHLDVVYDGKRIQATLTELNSLACAFERLSVADPALSGASIDRLRRVGEDLSQRLTYLLEPISPIEIDAEQCVVQLRSNPPQRDDDRTIYYELVVRKPDEIALCRYHKEPGDVRRVVPAHVTREVFLRLVSDLFSAAK